jgi:hypothetical protein
MGSAKKPVIIPTRKQPGRHPGKLTAIGKPTAATTDRSFRGPLRAIERFLLFLLGKRSDHRLFGLRQNNAKAVMTLEPAEVPVGLQPDVLDQGRTRAGEPHNLAPIQVPQSTNPVHVSRLQQTLQAGSSNVTNMLIILVAN